MAKLHLTEQQIKEVLDRVHAGSKVADVCREIGIAEQTFYRWKNRFAVRSGDTSRVRWLEGENSRLRNLIAELALENWELKKFRNARTRALDLSEDSQVLS